MIKLYYSSSSPFARKVRVSVREKGVLADVQEIECNPFAAPRALLQHSPLGKVPALAVEGMCVIDSTVICSYVDGLSSASPQLIPSCGNAHWRVRSCEALADGLLDVAVGMTLERRRPKAEQSEDRQRGWRKQMLSAVAAFDKDHLPTLPAGVDLGKIAVAVALGYLDFRYPELQWRVDHLDLASWFRDFDARPSMCATRPSDSSYALPPDDAGELRTAIQT
jgi:glutathione S-transferase